MGGFVSYLGGTLYILTLSLGSNEPFPTFEFIARTNWWAWTGGLFGAIYIGSSIMLLPRLSAASFVALLIAGADALIHFVRSLGIFGLVQRPVDPQRLFGAVLLIAGATLVLH